MSKLYDKAAEAVKKRNYDYAIELFIQELTLEPNNVEARKALRAAEMRKFQEAGLDPNGGAGAVLKGLGSMFGSFAHGLSKNHEKVMLDCEQMLKNGPRNKGALQKLAEAARAAGHIEAAICSYEDLLDADKESQPALRGLAQLWREKSDIHRALIYYERLKRVLPSDPEASKAVRDLAAAGASKKVEDAKAGAGSDGSFRDLIKDKLEADKLEKTGQRVRTADEADAAIQRLEGEIKKNPGEAPRFWKQIGDLHLKKKDPESALEAYEKAYELKKDPQVADAIGDLKIKQFEEEVNAVTEAAKAGDAGAKGRLKDAKHRRNEFMVEEYQRRVKERPTELALKFQLAQALVKLDRLDDAIPELQKATGDPRRGQQARLLLGKCFGTKGLNDLAIKELEKGRQGGSMDDDIVKEITFTIATVLEKSGQKAKAAAEYEKIIEVDIGYKNGDAMKRMEALKKEGGA